MDWLRLALVIFWGGGTLWFYGQVLAKRLRSWRLHHDKRSKRDLIAGIALFMVALSSSLSILVVLLGAGGTGIRGFFAAISLGAFLAAGIVMASEDAVAEASDV